MAGKLELTEVLTDEQFDGVMQVVWDSFETPFVPYLQVIYYKRSNSPEDRAEAVKVASERTLKKHKSDLGSHWIKVAESSSGSIGAVANWCFYRSSPFTAPEQPFEALWWPEGDGRKFATIYIKQVIGHKRALFDKPHACMLEPMGTLSGLLPEISRVWLTGGYQDLNIMCTLPGVRGHGIGYAMMEWGLKRADEMGLEAFLEATEKGRPLYERFGFEVLQRVSVDMTIDSPSDEWKELERKFLPCVFYIMRRPAGGKHQTLV